MVRKRSRGRFGRDGGQVLVPGRPVVLAILPQLIPSTVIGVVKPLMALHRQGRIVFEVRLESWVRRRWLSAADVVVFSRNTEPRYGAVLQAVRQLGTPIVYELDDDFFAIPPGTPGSEYHRDPGRLAQLEQYLRWASLVRVYSEALRARLASLNPNVHRVDALVDWSLVPTSQPPRPPGPLRIAYATSRPTDALAGMFMGDLERVLDTYRGRVEAWFWGYRPVPILGRPDVRCVDFIQDYDAFVRRFAASGQDVGLAPLPADEFHLAKSDNKFREYAASRVAGIYSDVVVYRDCVEPGQTGLFVPEEPHGWQSAMVRLLEDEQLRRRIVAGAWTYANRRYGVAVAAEIWLRQIESVLMTPKSSHPGGRSECWDVPVAMTGPGAISRLGRMAARTVEVLWRGAAPSTVGLGGRIVWHFESRRALWRLQRELAGAARPSAKPSRRHE